MIPPSATGGSAPNWETRVSGIDRRKLHIRRPSCARRLGQVGAFDGRGVDVVEVSPQLLRSPTAPSFGRSLSDIRSSNRLQFGIVGARFGK